MPSFTLYYFDARARAELIRLIFAATETPYNDIRVSNWTAEKETIKPPFGQLPVFDVDGVRLGQSLCIARFVARKTGLAGDNPIDEAKADMVVDCAKEIMDETISIIWDKNQQQKEERTKTFNKEKLLQKFGYLEKILESNGGDWFIGKKLNWADLAVIDVIKFVENEKHQIPWSSIPKIQAHRKKIESIPSIAKYIASRPEVVR